MWTTVTVLATIVGTTQSFFFGGGGGAACGCAAPPACPPPPPPSPCGGGGGGGYAAYSAPTAYAQPVYRPPPPQQFAPASYGSPSYAQQPAPFFPQPQQPQPLPQPPLPQAQPLGGGGGGGYQQSAPIGGGGSFGKASYAAPAKRNVRDEYETGVDQSEGYRVKRDDEAVFDPKCNSEDLKMLIVANINESTATSKRQIQSAAADALGGRIDVICSRGTFSYIVNTELYCETEKNGTTCFAFKQSS